MSEHTLLIALENDKNQRNKVVISPTLHPQYAEVINTLISSNVDEIDYEFSENFEVEKLISKIDGALKKIQDGTYGFCEETAEPIGLKRLIARPVATLCIAAQEKHEKNEKVYADD